MGGDFKTLNLGTNQMNISPVKFRILTEISQEYEEINILFLA